MSFRSNPTHPQRPALCGRSTVPYLGGIERTGTVVETGGWE
ncbi:hypothetical protein [Actinocatenispora rupis]|nr:hypothetical protein [Actinocatenispora rupis]